MPGRPAYRRPIPLRSIGIRLLAPRGGQQKPAGNNGIKWASCENYESSPFRRNIPVPTFGGINVTRGDLALLGLASAAITAPLSLAWSGPASAYFLIFRGAGGIISSTSIAQGLSTSLTGGLLAGLIAPRGPQFTKFSKPCSEDAGTGF